METIRKRIRSNEDNNTTERIREYLPTSVRNPANYLVITIQPTGLPVTLLVARACSRSRPASRMSIAPVPLLNAYVRNADDAYRLRNPRIAIYADLYARRLARVGTCNGIFDPVVSFLSLSLSLTCSPPPRSLFRSGSTVSRQDVSIYLYSDLFLILVASSPRTLREFRARVAS